MRILKRLSDFIGDLIQPRRVEAVAPPPPKELRDVARESAIRAVVAEVISGPDSTLVDKATFVVGPIVVDAAAAWGAAAGSQQRAQEGRGPNRGAIDVTGRKN